MKYDHIQTEKINLKNTINNIDNPILYLPEFFGFSQIKHKITKDVKICIIDSGFPVHKDIKKIDENFCIDFSNSDYGCLDCHGHSTAVSGILLSNNKNSITGLSPDSNFFYAKGVSDNGCADYGSIVASVLWAIVKNVDIIIMPFGGYFYDSNLHDAIKKAFRNNIAIISSAGNSPGDMTFPSNLPEILSVSCSYKNIKKVHYDGSLKKHDISLNVKNLTTTYIKDLYISISGSSMLSSVIGGICASIIQEYKDNKSNFSDPYEIYDKIIENKE